MDLYGQKKSYAQLMNLFNLFKNQLLKTVVSKSISIVTPALLNMSKFNMRHILITLNPSINFWICHCSRVCFADTFEVGSAFQGVDHYICEYTTCR